MVNIIESSIRHLQSNVARNIFLTARFNGPLDASTITEKTVILAETISEDTVTGVVDYIIGTYTVTFQLYDYLKENTSYTFVLVGGANGIKASNGSPFSLQNIIIRFTTGTVIDSNIPLATLPLYDDNAAFQGAGGIYQEVIGRVGEPISHIVTTAGHVGTDGVIVSAPGGVTSYLASPVVVPDLVVISVDPINGKKDVSLTKDVTIEFNFSDVDYTDKITFNGTNLIGEEIEIETPNISVDGTELIISPSGIGTGEWPVGTNIGITIDQSLSVIASGLDPSIYSFVDGSGVISASETNIPVLNSLIFPANGYVQIGNEIVYYPSRNTTTLLNCSRGVLESTASTHQGSLSTSVNSILSSQLLSTADTIRLTSNSLFPLSGDIVVDDEIIKYIGKEGDEYLINCTRGGYQSTPVIHPSGTLVCLFDPQEDVIRLYHDTKYLGTDYTFSFLTKFYPMYSTVLKIRSRIGDLIKGLSDDIIKSLIYENSLDSYSNAVPQFAIGSPSVAAINYIVCKTQLDCLYREFFKGGPVSRKRLADLEIDYGRGFMDVVTRRISDLENCVKKNWLILTSGKEYMSSIATIKSGGDSRYPTWTRTTTGLLDTTKELT